jgi:hypothetical protein
MFSSLLKPWSGSGSPSYPETNINQPRSGSGLGKLESGSGFKKSGSEKTVFGAAGNKTRKCYEKMRRKCYLLLV